MPSWLLSIMSILGLAGQVAPVVESLLSALGTFVSTEISKLAPSSGGGADSFLQGVINQLENGVMLADTVAADIEAEIVALYPTVEQLLAAFPGLAQSLSLRSSLVQDTGLSHGVAAKLVEVAHANVRVAQAKP